LNDTGLTGSVKIEKRVMMDNQGKALPRNNNRIAPLKEN
jgi:hypothetical protein